jgi:hypothetical protein
VGEAVVSADAFVTGLEAVFAGKASTLAAPRDARPSPSRAGQCLRCKRPIEVTMDLRIHQLTCAECGCVQPVAAHVSDVERMQIDQQRQIAENEALKALRAEGTSCPGCGGHVPVGATGVQATCGFCGAVVVLSGLVGEDALARERLGTGVRAAIDEARSRQERRSSWVTALVVGGIVALVVVGLTGAAVVSAVGALFAALR